MNSEVLWGVLMMVGAASALFLAIASSCKNVMDAIYIQRVGEVDFSLPALWWAVFWVLSR